MPFADREEEEQVAGVYAHVVAAESWRSERYSNRRFGALFTL
jgi:hypothetical protein